MDEFTELSPVGTPAVRSSAGGSGPQREEIAELGQILGNTIQAIAGTESLQVVESIRRLSRDRRNGDRDADRRLLEMFAALDKDQLRVIIRAFTVFLDLANVAEDRQRVRVLRDRARKVYPSPTNESIEAALTQLKAAGRSAADVQRLLDRLQIELVFTAHPTEAKRRSVRRKLRRIRELLDESNRDLLPTEAARVDRLIRAELAKLWLTDFFRPWRPTVLQEVQRGLSMKTVLWDVVPRIVAEMRAALSQVYPGHVFRVRPCIGFGSWIGGDRDGHPYVTVDVTRQTVRWLRQAALDFHVEACRELFTSLSLSERQVAVDRKFADDIVEVTNRWPSLSDELSGIPPNEVFRRWLAVIEWRLRRTQDVELDGPAVEGAYATAEALDADVRRMHDALVSVECGELLAAEVSEWLDRIRVFGFHLARLDVRQDSHRYLEVINELRDALSGDQSAASLSEAQRQDWLAGTISEPLQLRAESLSEETRETLSLFRLLRRIYKAFGPQTLGGHVVSMTHSPGDILTVLWLWNHADLDQAARTAETLPPLPIIPLFETIEDLQQAPRVFGALLGIPAYRDHLRKQDDRQIVMLGYSDSTKNGGYLSACWSLYRCQQQLYELASRDEIELTFFHGRGGSLGRGGGPAARSILSLPPPTFRGSLRITEQGEVLADRYDDPRIAHRHLEQVIWSSLLASGVPPAEVSDAWRQTMEQLAQVSLNAYREFVEQPGFVDFFRRATPVAEIERLPIGSRPARRRGGHELSDLRAIPWVFSWTQARCLVPAWFGIGVATAASLDDPPALERLRSMYHQWPFFRATIDNAELALAKSDLGIFEHYAKLANDSETFTRIRQMIATEFAQAKRAILAITQTDELLDSIPWLQESIRVRNRYIDPLNLIQVELLRRLRACGSGGATAIESELRHLTRLSINGVAAGMRTSG